MPNTRIYTDNNSTLPTHEYEPFKLSDGAVIGTLLAVGALLIIAVGVGTWQCIKKSKAVAFRPRRTPFSRLRSSQRSALSRQSTTLSPEQFHRLLDLYHRSGTGSELDTGVFDVDDSKHNRRSLHPPQFQDDPIQTQISPRKHPISRLPFHLSPQSSIQSYCSPERLRQSSGSTPGSQPHYPVSIISATLLDLNSPQQNVFEEADMDRFAEYRCLGGRFLRSHPGNRSKRTFSSPPYFGRSNARSSISAEFHSPESGIVSPLKSPSNMDTAEQKPFYFAWPEEEEEANGSGWSPLLLKASMDTTRDGVSVGDEKVLLAKQTPATNDPGYDEVDLKSVSLGGGSKPAETPEKKEIPRASSLRSDAPSLSPPLSPPLSPSLSPPQSPPTTDPALSLQTSAHTGESPGGMTGVVTSTNILLPYGLKSTWV